MAPGLAVLGGAAISALLFEAASIGDIAALSTPGSALVWAEASEPEAPPPAEKPACRLAKMLSLMPPAGWRRPKPAKMANGEASFALRSRHCAQPPA